ncbi:MAG: transglycosylase SLT domain-containing protein, partial [Pseudomonadota bacterium]
MSTKISYSLYQDSQDKEKSKQLKKSRKLFKQALTALEKNRTKSFNQYLKKLKDYPLIVFLDYKKLRKNLNKAKNKEIDQFIKQYQDTPYADKIRKKWLDKLAKKKYWKSYLAFYTPQKSTRRQCNYLYALIKNNRKNEAFKQVKTVWLNAKSQPKSCDPVFKAWEDAGYISNELRWQRIQLAMQKGRISLAKYISKAMNKADKAILSQWITVHRRPKKLLNSKIVNSKHKMQQDIVLHSIKRQARKKPQQAVKLLTAIQKKIKIDPDKLDQAYRAIGISFARKHQLGGWYWLNKIADDNSDLYIQEWRVRAAIREQNNQAIISSIKRLSEEKQQSQRWQFWLAKAIVSEGKENEKKENKKIAKKIYQKLSQHRSYYAFLAADKMNKPYAFNDKPITYKPKKFAQIKKHPSIERAFEFLILAMKTQAKREWYFATQKLFNQEQQVLAAKLAQSWGWHDRAIITIAHTDERDDIRLRFPVILEKTVEKYSRLNQLDAAYTYAVIRRESAFAVEARSPVGAMGLMQIMPATG